MVFADDDCEADMELQPLTKSHSSNSKRRGQPTSASNRFLLFVGLAIFLFGFTIGELEIFSFAEHREPFDNIVVQVEKEDGEKDESLTENKNSDENVNADDNNENNEKELIDAENNPHLSKLQRSSPCPTPFFTTDMPKNGDANSLIGGVYPLKDTLYFCIVDESFPA